MKTRFSIFLSLVFSLQFISCSERDKPGNEVTINWNGNRAESINIPMSLIPGNTSEFSQDQLEVQYSNTGAAMLGDYLRTTKSIEFRPVIAFTGRLTYKVVYAGKVIAELVIPEPAGQEPPEVIAVYPSTETVPENLLKFHIQFSKPMQEGQALENIVVLKNWRDTVSVFLDLEQELWNKDRTMLSLWLDPGRIKRDLQPNIKSGPPLLEGSHYSFTIIKNWRDSAGDSLNSTYTKDYYVGARDGFSPHPENWNLQIPAPGTQQPLKMYLHESLDKVLLINAIQITDQQGKLIKGLADTEASETFFIFTPSFNWIPGDYQIEIEARLEDLAGNNLNRLFDRDLRKNDSLKRESVYKRRFQVQ